MLDGCDCKESLDQPPACPQCGEETRVIPIVYGLPAPWAIQEHMDGKLELGGSFIQPGNPCWRCKNCEFAFGSALG